MARRAVAVAGPGVAGVDGGELGGGEGSAMVGTTARGRARPGKKGEKKQGSQRTCRLLVVDGDALETTRRRWRSAAAGGDEGDGDGSTGHPASCVLMERTRELWRSFCACRRGEGEYGGYGERRRRR